MKSNRKCQVCPKMFYKRPSELKNQKNHYCSWKCYQIDKPNNHPNRKFFHKIGDTLGYLTLLNIHEIPNQNKTYWNCKCICKNEVIREQWYLHYLYSNNKIISCGCKHTYKKGKDHSKFKGFGDLSLSFFNNIVKHAKTRNLEFNITIQDAWNQFIKQNNMCTYTGQKLEIQNIKSNKKNRTASLDRIDSSKGYTIDNIQWIHKDINIMKGKLSEKRFLELINSIYRHKLSHCNIIHQNN